MAPRPIAGASGTAGVAADGPAGAAGAAGDGLSDDVGRIAELIVRGPERMAITGPNGAGKTTLLRTLAGAPADGGTLAAVMTRRNAASGYLPQRLDILDDALTVVDNVRAVAPRASVNEVRAGLARFLFRGARADQVAGSLSGGERFRAVLAALLLADPPPQLLLLDEPTNNLDLASVRQLSQALSCYRGALVVVSHDVPFLHSIGITRWLRLDRSGRLADTEPPGGEGAPPFRGGAVLSGVPPDIGDRLPVWLGWACRRWTNGRSSPTPRGWRASCCAGPCAPRAARISRFAGCCSTTWGPAPPRCRPSPTPARCMSRSTCKPAWRPGLSADPRRQHEVIGITGVPQMRFNDITIGDLIQVHARRHVRQRGSRRAGHDEPALRSRRADQAVRHQRHLPGPRGHRPARDHVQAAGLGMRHTEVNLQVIGTSQDRAEEVLREIRGLAVERSVFRGQVISFGPELLGPATGSTPLTFLPRPSVSRGEVVLPGELLADIERQVAGVARHSGRLLASGQHLKRGVLLYGAPGTGKTHTVRYLLTLLPAVTVIAISGKALGRITEACSVARTLQPAIIVVEDVDLIAEERTARPGEHPLLFQLLNEMEGLNSAADVTFLLTTNRADLLEPALAARPGRVDLAAELPLPDAAARRALLRLYQGNLDLDGVDLEPVIERTDGVTAPFLRELLRKAALLAAEDDDEGRPRAERQPPVPRCASPRRSCPPRSTSCSAAAGSSPGCCLAVSADRQTA